MDIWQRMVRYLILWAGLFGVLCVISVIRYWEELSFLVKDAFSGYVYVLLVLGLIVAGIVWLFRPR